MIFLNETNPSKWQQGTLLVIFYNGIYIYRYTFTILQYTFIGRVCGGPAAHLYQIYGSGVFRWSFFSLKVIASRGLTPPPPPALSHLYNVIPTEPLGRHKNIDYHQCLFMPVLYSNLCGAFSSPSASNILWLLGALPPGAKPPHPLIIQHYIPFP